MIAGPTLFVTLGGFALLVTLCTLAVCTGALASRRARGPDPAPWHAVRAHDEELVAENAYSSSGSSRSQRSRQSSHR